MPIRHIVILNFKKTSNIDYISLIKKTKPLIESIQGVNQYRIYKNESKYTPDTVFSVGVQIDFENDKSFDNFMNDPRHYKANAIFEMYLADPPFAVLTYHV